MTTGSPTSSADKTEAFDVVASTTCQSLPAYPLSTDSATGAFVNTKAVICGGYPAITNCYTLSKSENTWKLSGNLITGRESAASVEINNKLVVFGGYNYGVYLESTEEFDADSGTATAGPNMPLPIGFHCAVKVNDTTVLIIGGYDGSSRLSSSYFYNPGVTSGKILNQRYNLIETKNQPDVNTIQ